jgi:hypothetical protein
MPKRVYPGDEIIKDPSVSSTYWTTIQADPPTIWPWIVQLGYHRGGWYIDAWWDRIIQQYFWPLIVPPDARGEYRPPAGEVIPELQNLKVDDIVPDGPPGSAFYKVVALEKFSHLLLHSTTHLKFLMPSFTIGTRFEPFGEFSWAYVLEGIGLGQTRLTIRFRGSGSPPAIIAILKPIVYTADYFHVREMLKGIKRRAETGGL